MYKNHPSLVLGFHACERVIGEGLLSGSKGFKASSNLFDWLGHGMYFWENSPERATSYGIELRDIRKKLKDPYVIGAVISLGRCFNLLEENSLELLKESYNLLKKTYDVLETPMPFNKTAFMGDQDSLKRHLDCAVIEYMHSNIKDTKHFDSVRGVFWEGEELYPNAGFKEKNHIQLCVRNPNCIKGYFKPLEIDKDYTPV